MFFEIIGNVEDVHVIAVGDSIREAKRLVRVYGAARWRKLKGTAKVRLRDGTARMAEVHWYEATGIGRKEMKLKRLLRERP